LIGARYGASTERVVVIPRGIDLAGFDRAAIGARRMRILREAWGIAAGERVVLNLARLTPWKGQRILIEAAQQLALSHPGAVVVLAGDAQGREEYRLELARMIESRGLAGRVRIVGHVEDAPAALAVADVAVIASTEPEAFGRTAIEAAAVGVPVVATALGATAETVLAPPAVGEYERTGWLVPPGDSAALSAAIGAALDFSPLARGAFAARARSHAESFSTAAMQSATLALYDRLLSARGIGDSISKR
jgi:glycosyltransferase involved in cell wall biosynthesis